MIDICQVEIVSISDRFGIGIPFLDERVHLPDADASSSDVRLVHEIMNDTTGLLLDHTFR